MKKDTKKEIKNEKKKEKLKQAFLKRTSEMRKYQVISFVVIVILFLLFLVPFGYIHNTAMNDGKGGTEVSFTGFNLLGAALANNYKSTKYGDISIPFYYYAKNYISSMGDLMIIIFILLILVTGLLVYMFIMNKQGLSLISTILFGLIFILLFSVFVASLAMKDSNILPIYCSGNKACSIRSNAIIPAIGDIAGIILSVINYISYRKAKKIYEQ